MFAAKKPRVKRIAAEVGTIGWPGPAVAGTCWRGDCRPLRVNLKAVARSVVAAASMVLGTPSGVAAPIAGTAHDFSADFWAGGQVCVLCHTPRKASDSASAAPLWNHTVATRAYSLYAPLGGKVIAGQPSAGDKLCLSCHDGTVARDRYRSLTGVALVSTANNLSVNLGVHHPTSFVYDRSLAMANGPLFDPTTKMVTVGTGNQVKTGTVGAVLLSAGLVQCSSCHDVHNTFNATAKNLLKISMATSAMCFACHNY
jgi:predicted CXXCH cytochrome family protein